MQNTVASRTIPYTYMIIIVSVCPISCIAGLFNINCLPNVAALSKGVCGRVGEVELRRQGDGCQHLLERHKSRKPLKTTG